MSELDKYNEERLRIVQSLLLKDLVKVISQEEEFYYELLYYMRDMVYNESEAFPMSLIKQFEQIYKIR